MRTTSLASLSHIAIPNNLVPDSPPLLAPAPTSGSSKQLQPSEAVHDAVLQIEAAYRVPDTVQPWLRGKQLRSCGTAFAVADGLVFTSAFHVLHATHLTLRRRGQDTPFVATVCAVSQEADLAVLRVLDSDKFWSGSKPLELTLTLPELQSRVASLAFRGDTDNVISTTSAVSRIMSDTFGAAIGTRLLGVVDSPQPPLNDRGAPVVDASNRVVGMLTWPRARFVASETLQLFLTEFRETGSFKHVPHIGFEWQPAMNQSMRRWLGMPADSAGVYVRAVPANAPSAGMLQAGDVVTALDGVPVSSKGTVTLRGRETVTLSRVTAKKRAGDTLCVDVLRGGQKLSVCYPLVEHVKTSLIPCRRFDSAPDYVTIGGLVFMTLTEQLLLETWGTNWFRKAPLDMLSLLDDEMPLYGDEGTDCSEGAVKHTRSVRSFVVLTRILTSRMTVAYENDVSIHTRLFRLNGRVVSDLRDLIGMLRECTDEYLLFEFEEEVIVLDRMEAVAESPAILAAHGATNAARYGGIAGDIDKIADTLLKK